MAFTIVAGFLLIAARDARLLIRHDPDAEHPLALELHVRGDDDGASDFSVPPGWGGVARIADHLHDVAFADESGAPLVATRASELHWSVAHPPGASIVARWWLGDPQPAANGTGNDYRPFVAKERFHFLGSIGLLRPDALAGAAKHRFAIDFSGCDGEGRAALCSFGAGPHLEVEETLDAFCHSIWMGGAMRLHARDLAGHELMVGIAGKFAFDDADFVALTERIIRLERDFFADAGEARFVVTAVPEPREPEGRSLGGTGLTRSFALFMAPAFGLKPGSDDHLRISSLLAHEHFHHWNGGVVRGGEEEEGLGYWFSEGFTDFFTRRLMARSGTWSVKQWLGEWNRCLAAFARNPARGAPASRIAQEFWSDRNVSDLPYQRGAIVAALLDREIRATSGGAQSLDDFMRDVVARGRAGEPASTAALLELVADATSAEFAERVRAIVVDGALPPFDDESLFGPAFRLKSRPPNAGEGDAPIPTLALLPGTSEEAARAGT
jgi:predicted metalloprotease with PDZ domain